MLSRLANLILCIFRQWINRLELLKIFKWLSDVKNLNILPKSFRVESLETSEAFEGTSLHPIKNFDELNVGFIYYELKIGGEKLIS